MHRSQWDLKTLVLPLLSAAVLIVLVMDLFMGPAEIATSITPGAVVHIVMHHLHLEPARATTSSTLVADQIVWQLRLPRALCGLAVGMLLALAGVAFQSFLMNPLADPYMVGVSAGSALGSATVVLMGGTAWLSGLAQPAAAFGAGLASMLLITALARINGRVSAQTFLLAGIVLGTFVYSITRLIIAIANRSNDTGKSNAILSQLLGSLQGATWADLLLLAPFGILGSFLLLRSCRELNLMAMGEETASHLGVNIELFKRRIITSGSLVTAATVSVAGIIGFIGMVVPHVGRRLVGPDHRVLLPVSMLLGGLVLLLSDWFARVYLHELEVGVVTSLIGAPIFCYLLRSRLVSRW